MAQKLPKYLPSPARRTHTQEFDYRDLIVDKGFHALIEEKRENGVFDGVTEGTAEFNSTLKKIALDFVRAENENRAALFLNRGILYAREYKIYREAISCYNRALEISSDSPSRYVTLANRAAAYLKTKQYADALVDAREAARLCPSYAIAHSLVGYCQSRLGQVREAIVNYKLALRLNPADECSQELLEDAKKALSGCGENIDDIESPTPEVSSSTVEGFKDVNSIEPCMDLSRPTHRRYLNSVGRVASIQDIVRKALLLHDDKGIQGILVSVDDLPPPGTEKMGRAKLSFRRVNALKSMTKLPEKLKRALGKKHRGLSPLESLEVSAGGHDLHGKTTEDIAKAIDRFRAGKKGYKKLAELSSGPPQIAQLMVSKKAPVGSDSLVYSQGLNDGAASTPTASAAGTPVGGTPLLRGDAADSSIYACDEPEQREAWRSPQSSDDPGIMSDVMPFEGHSEGKAASPETVGYNEGVLRGCLPQSTLVCKGQSSPCPDGPPVSSEVTGPVTQSQKTSHLSPASERPASVPLLAASPLDEEPTLPSSFDLRLGAMNAHEAVALTLQPSPAPESNSRAAERTTYKHRGGQQRVVRLQRAKELDVFLMNKSQKLAWTSSEASNEAEDSGRESSGAAAVVKLRIEEGAEVVAASPEGDMPRDWLFELHNGGKDRRNDAKMQSLSDSNQSTALGLIGDDVSYTGEVPTRMSVRDAIVKIEQKGVLPPGSQGEDGSSSKISVNRTSRAPKLRSAGAAAHPR